MKESSSATITRSHPARPDGRVHHGPVPDCSGLTTVGTPGGKLGIQSVTPTLAEILKPLGYATAQFGKNHLGDRNEHLPTVHGFDEFYGISTT